MKKTISLCALAIFGLIAGTQAGPSPSPATSPGGWYGGLEGGYIQHKFNPRYTPASGASSFDFINRSEGIELGLVAGYDFALADRFSVATQLRGAWNNSEWTYFLKSEPARFKYDNPFNIEFSVNPSYQVTDKLRVFVTVGIIEGEFNEEKNTSSPTHGDYDASEWVFGYTFGGGISYQFSDTLECRLSYRKSIYDSFSYRDYLPSGARKNSISDEPESETFALSFIYRF